MNLFISDLGIDAPHALSCPPPDPPNLVESLFTNLPRWTLHVLDPRIDTA